MKIWISHSFSDDDFVNRLKKALINQGNEIVLDDSLAAGDYLLGKITKSIKEADALLLVISKHFSKSPWLNTEVGLIISEISTTQKKIFIPILIDKGIKLQSYLMQYYYIDYTNGKSFEENTQKILNAINDKKYQRENNITIQQTISDALIQQEKKLIADKTEYLLKQNVGNEFKIFSLLTVIMTLLSSIILILYFIKNTDGGFNNMQFSIISFMTGTISGVGIALIVRFKKRDTL